MKESDSLLRIPLRAVNVTVCHAVVLMLLASMLGFKVPLIMYVLIFFASLACSVVADCLRPAERRITAFVVTVVLLAVGTLLHEKTINGAFWFARRFVELINQYYGEVLQWKADPGTESGMLFLLALINIFGCMVLTRIYKNCRGFLFWLAPAFLPLYVAVIANIFPAPGKMVAFALMLVFLKCTVSWERMPGRQVFLYELLLGGLLFLTAFGLPQFVTREVSGKWNKDHKQNGGMSGGKLSSDGVAFTHKTHLLVSLPKNSPQTYLRGFVGADYMAGSWTEALDRAEFISYARRFFGRPVALAMP